MFSPSHKGNIMDIGEPVREFDKEVESPIPVEAPKPVEEPIPEYEPEPQEAGVPAE
jgi:hypothetical protein